MGNDEMPYAGIASFFKAPYVPQPTPADGEVAVLGVPYDEGTTNRSGARMGPRALREVSTYWSYRDGADLFYDGEAEVQLMGGVRWVDCGDVALAPNMTPEPRHTAIIERLQPLVEAGLFPVTLGGDHSISYPLLTAISRARHGKPFQLVQFDTHMDYWDDEGDQRFTHASPIIRAHETRHDLVCRLLLEKKKKEAADARLHPPQARRVCSDLQLSEAVAALGVAARGFVLDRATPSPPGPVGRPSGIDYLGILAERHGQHIHHQLRVVDPTGSLAGLRGCPLIHLL